MKKENRLVLAAGVAVGLAALALTALGNPGNMGFCIACFARDIAGAVGLHSAAKVQYVRPEIIGLVLGAFAMIGALVFLGCPLRMVLRLGGGDLNAVVGLLGFVLGICIGIVFLRRGFDLKRSYPARTLEVLVDDPCAVENISRFAASNGYTATSVQNGEEAHITLTKK